MEKNTRGNQPFKGHKASHIKSAENNQQTSASPPYSKMFSNADLTLPWIMPQQAFFSWFALQQAFWEGYWQLLSWECSTLHQISIDNTRAMVHAIQLSSEPQTFYRYMRMNWKKPYEHGTANAFTASRLYGQIWSDYFLAWQNALSPCKGKKAQ